MIILFTDFSANDIYVGQAKAVLAQTTPSVPVIDLLHNTPAFDIESGAHLLSALYRQFMPGSVFFTVVDPGVGSARDAVVMAADGYYFVGPDNGLLSVVAARTETTRTWRITWRPEKLSDSFHGRDLFAPVAAWIATGQFPADKLEQIDSLAVQASGEDLARIIYIDHYGNCLTGVRTALFPDASSLSVASETVCRARTFSDVSLGVAFWYENSLGLVEIAAVLRSAWGCISVMRWLWVEGVFGAGEACLAPTDQ